MRRKGKVLAQGLERDGRESWWRIANLVKDSAKHEMDCASLQKTPGLWTTEPAMEVPGDSSFSSSCVCQVEFGLAWSDPSAAR